jgi:hypothetical protein
MNRYGAMAREHWQLYQPTQYAQLADPATFFTQIGQDMSARITTLSLSLAGDDPGEEGFLEKVGRLNMARLQAEEQVMREMLPPSENDDPH